MVVLINLTGSPRSGKLQGKTIFSRSRESQGILHQAKEILTSTSKSVKIQGILFLLATSFGNDFYCW